MLMVFEDAHWIDPTSRELLDLAVDQVRRLPVLLVGHLSPRVPAALERPRPCHEPGAQPARRTRRRGPGAQLWPAMPRSAARWSAEIVERTDGVPLFVEELTKAVLESAVQGDRVAAVLGATSQTALSVPATLHASLMARLDRLGPAAKEVAQIGAVLGREFGYELIEPVAQRPRSESCKPPWISSARPGCCSAVVSPPHSTYLFKHALVQDAAYWTLLRGPTAGTARPRRCGAGGEISPISSSASRNCSPIT